MEALCSVPQFLKQGDLVTDPALQDDSHSVASASLLQGPSRADLAVRCDLNYLGCCHVITTD